MINYKIYKKILEKLGEEENYLDYNNKDLVKNYPTIFPNKKVVKHFKETYRRNTETAFAYLILIHNGGRVLCENFLGYKTWITDEKTFVEFMNENNEKFINAEKIYRRFRKRD